MNRCIKYPDTSTFHFYNANPHNKFTDDCVFRAICTAEGDCWENVLKELFEISLKTGYSPFCVECYERYLAKLGWIKQKQPRKQNGTLFTGKEFCLAIQSQSGEIAISMNGNYIAHMGNHHIAAIVNGKVYDTFDSTDGRVGNYWVKMCITRIR